jgi:hypothetical protein
MTGAPGSHAHLSSSISAERVTGSDDILTEPPLNSDDRETQPGTPDFGITTPVPPSRDLVITQAPDSGPDAEDGLPGNERRTIVLEHWVIAIDGAARSAGMIEQRLRAIALSAGFPDPRGTDGNAVLRCSQFRKSIPPFANDPESTVQPTMSIRAAQICIGSTTRVAYEEAVAAITACSSASDDEVQRRLADFQRFYLQATGAS